VRLVTLLVSIDECELVGCVSLEDTACGSLRLIGCRTIRIGGTLCRFLARILSAIAALGSFLIISGSVLTYLLGARCGVFQHALRA